MEMGKNEVSGKCGSGLERTKRRTFPSSFFAASRFRFPSLYRIVLSAVLSRKVPSFAPATTAPSFTTTGAAPVAAGVARRTMAAAAPFVRVPALGRRRRGVWGGARARTSHGVS